MSVQYLEMKYFYLGEAMELGKYEKAKHSFLQNVITTGVLCQLYHNQVNTENISKPSSDIKPLHL